LEELLSQGASIVEEHPNKFGEEAVIVQMPDGHRRSFGNVKADTLKELKKQLGSVQAKEQPQQTSQTEHHTKLEEYIKNGGKIISEHSNKRGDETVVIEMSDGRRQSFPNVRPETIEQLLASESGEQSTRTVEQSAGGSHTKLEEYLNHGGKIVSEHSNRRGDEAVMIEMPDGRRQSFPNVKAETVEQLLKLQSESGGQGSKTAKQTSGGTQQASEGTRTKLEEYIKNGGQIVTEHPNMKGDETVVIEMPDGRRQSFPNVNPLTLEQILSFQQQEASGNKSEGTQPKLQEHKKSEMHTSNSRCTII